MGFSLPRKLKDNFLTRGASRVIDQVNPFDNNRTWQQRAPTQNKSNVSQLGQILGQTGRSVAPATIKTVNTAKAGVGGVYGLGKVGAVSVFGSDEGYKKELSGVNKTLTRDLQGGILGMGGLVRSAEEAGRLTPVDIAKKSVGTGVEAYLEGKSMKVGGLSGKTLVKEGLQKGFKKELPNIGKSAALNTAQGGASAYNQGASGKDMLKSAAMGGTIGTVADVGLGLAGAGLSKATKSQIKPVEAIYDPKIKAAQKQTLESIAEKPKVAFKQTRIDPNDPFGNSKYLKRLKNETGKLFVDEDAPMITMLRKIEKDTGRTDLVEQFMFDTNTQRASRSIANAKVKNSPDFEAAVRGLSKKDLDNFDTYAAAKAELLNYDGKKTSKNAETLAAIVKDGDAQFSARYDSLNKYYKSLAEDLRKEGIISDARFQEFIKDGNYIRLQRNMEDLVAPNVGASRARSLNTTSANQKRMGSSREVLPPTQTAIARTQQLQNEIQKNRTARNTMQNLEQYGLAKKLVDSEDVKFRQDVYKFLSDTKEGTKVVDSLLKKDSKAMRRLQSEVDKLNKQGLDEYLKSPPSKPEVSLKSKTTVVRRVKTDDALKDLRGSGKWKVGEAPSVTDARKELMNSKWWNQAKGDYTDSLKAYAKKNKLSNDDAIVNQYMKTKGFDEYTKDGKTITLSKRRVEKRAAEMGAMGETPSEVLSASSSGSNLTNTKVRQAVGNLITEDSSKLAAIKRKLGNREPKLKALIEEVEQLRDTSEAFKTARKDAYNSAMARLDDSTKNKNTISYYKDGIKEVYEVPKDIKEVMDNVQPYTLGAVAQIVSAPARVFRAGTTALSAPFTVTNYLRDQASSGIYSKNVIATHNPQNIIAGLRKATRDFVGETNDPLWKKFETYAGDQTIFDELRNVKNTKRLLREKRMTGGKYVNQITNPIRTLEDLNSITEKATRFQNFKGIYEKAIKEGADESVAIRKAVQAAYDNSVNFQRSGTASRVINMFIPYFNAGIQGSRNVARSFRDRPMATAGKSVGFVAIPAVAAAAYNMSDERRREVYENINDFEKENNYIIVLPGAKQKEDGSYEGVIKIPKPQGYRELVDPTRDMAEQFFRGEKPEVAASMLKDMLGGFTGPINTEDGGKFISSITPQAAKPLLQAGINKDLYTGGQIVPEYMMEETSDPTKRKYEGTSGTANWIAQQLGVEPIKVEKFVSDTFGSLGRYGLNTADNTVKATGNEDWVIGGRSAKSDFSRRMFEATAKEKENLTAGQLYYKDRKEITSGLSANAKAAYDTLHPKKENFLGETMYDQDSIFNKNARLDIYKRYPEVFEADKELDRRNRERGQPGNPLYDLTQEQVTRVLFKEALPPGAKDPELSSLYKEQWYQDYRNNKTAFFDQLRAKAAQEGKPWSDDQNPYPEPSAELQAKMDYYNTLPSGTGARSAFLRANPDVLAQWDAVDNWENGQRVRMGLSPVGDETQFGSASVSSGSGYGGGYGSSSSRSSGKGSGSSGVSFKKPTVPAGKALDKVSLKSNAPEIRTKKSVKRRPRPKIQLRKSMV